MVFLSDSCAARWPESALVFLSRSVFYDRAYSSLVSSSLILIFPSDSVVWIVAETHPGLTLELPIQKARGFLVSVALSWWFLDNTHKLFGEIPVRI
jgi:hypothetical protein